MCVAILTSFLSPGPMPWHVEGIEQAVERVQAYADAGADLVYVEAPEQPRILESLPSLVGHPLVINMLTGGRTPTRSVDELRSYGYKLVIWPIETILCSARYRSQARANADGDRKSRWLAG